MQSTTSPNGTLLVNTVHHGTMELVSIPNGKSLHIWYWDAYFTGALFPSDSKLIYLTYGDKHLNVDTKQKTHTLPHANNITVRTLSPINGDLFTGTTEGEIYHWNHQSSDLHTQVAYYIQQRLGPQC